MIKFNHTAHKELWDWLAKNPEKGKREWSGWIENRGGYYAALHCFACDYAEDERTGDRCEACPLIWDNFDNICYLGIFGAWEDEKNLQKRTKWAEKIRDLPVKEGVERI